MGALCIRRLVTRMPRAATWMAVANHSPGVNTNVLSPPTFVDEPSGDGTLNGISVTAAGGADLKVPRVGKTNGRRSS